MDIKGVVRVNQEVGGDQPISIPELVLNPRKRRFSIF